MRVLLDMQPEWGEGEGLRVGEMYREAINVLGRERGSARGRGRTVFQNGFPLPLASYRPKVFRVWGEETPFASAQKVSLPPHAPHLPQTRFTWRMERRRIVQAFRHCRPSCGQRKDARPFGHAAGTGRRGGLARRGDVQGGDKRLGKGEGEREGERENRFSKRFPSPPRIIPDHALVQTGMANIDPRNQWRGSRIYPLK